MAPRSLVAAANDPENAARTVARVAPGLYVGGYLAAADPRVVAGLGVTRIAKMFADDPARPAENPRHPGVAYLVCDAVDLPGYDIRPDALRALAFVRAGRAAGERVLVHCHAGISRSVTVALLYLMIHEGLSLDAALAQVWRARPFAQPNRGFMAHLRATDIRLRRMRSLLPPGPAGPGRQPPAGG